MNFPKYQESIIKELYDECLKDENTVILLSGKSGCGKSHIVQGLAESLSEGWRIFLIEGIEKTLSPYQTLYIGTKLRDRKKFSPNISLGIEFAPLTFSMSPHIENKHYIFNEYEQAIIHSIKSKDTAMPNLLIIADNFNEWDQSSIEFLIKLNKLNPFHSQNLKILIVSDEYRSNFIKINSVFRVPDFSSDDYEDICNVLGIVHHVDITEAQACAGENIGLLKLYCEYIASQSDKAELSINTIISSKIEGCDGQDKEHIKNIPPLAIIDGHFSVYDAAYSEENSEKKYADVISTAKKYNFLYGNGEYCFSSDAILDYFKSQLNAKEELLHKDFAMYLKNKRPEDYFSRAKHLIDTNDKACFEEAYYLLLIEQLRRKSIQSSTEYFEVFFEKIRDSIDVSDILDNCTYYERGMEAFLRCDYRSAITHFKQVIFLATPDVFHAEVLRNIVTSLVLLANDYDEIEKVSKELFDIIADTKFNEKEQWVRAAMILISVHTDRIYDDKKTNYLSKKMESILKDNKNSEFFKLMEHHYKRRSAMFYPPPMAMRCSRSSVEYFGSRYDINEEYKAQCNLGANCLICGEYNEAKNAIERCIKLVDCNPDTSFPSQYKIKNNHALVQFFSIAENNLKMSNYLDENIVLQSARVALKDLESIGQINNGEVSYVICLNQVSFLLLLGEFEKASLLIADLSSKVRKDDLFYSYYLNNMKIAYNCLTGNRELALEILNSIKDVFVPLIKNCQKIFHHRNQAIEEIICNEKLPTPFQFNIMLLSGKNSQGNVIYLLEIKNLFILSFSKLQSNISSTSNVSNSSICSSFKE